MQAGAGPARARHDPGLGEHLGLAGSGQDQPVAEGRGGGQHGAGRMHGVRTADRRGPRRQGLAGGGIGPRLVQLLKKALRLPPGVTEPRVLDLLWHLPTGVIDRRAEPTVAGAVPGTIATFAVRVLREKGARGKDGKWDESGVWSVTELLEEARHGAPAAAGKGN